MSSVFELASCFLTRHGHSWVGSAWTRLHRPLCYLVPPRPVRGGHAGIDEDAETKIQMKQYGIDFVRGSPKNNPDIPSETQTNLNKTQINLNSLYM